MSDDPMTPRTPELVELDEDPPSNSPAVESETPTTLRPSTSPTSSTPSSSPNDKGLKESELLSSDESLVDSPIVQIDNGTANPNTEVGRDVNSDTNVKDKTPIIKVDNWEGRVRVKASPVQEDSGRNEVNSPPIQIDSGEDKEVGIPLIDLE